jgi:hypothetical protein
MLVVEPMPGRELVRGKCARVDDDELRLTEAREFLFRRSTTGNRSALCPVEVTVDHRRRNPR